MTAPDTSRGGLRSGTAHALLAAALLAATALVRVPTDLYRASAQDFASASRDLLLVLFAAGLLAFAGFALVVALLPARLRGYAGPPLVAVAAYAWIRAAFFPGPSVTLDGSRITADLSTGAAGLLVPLAGAVLLAGLGTRQPRVVTTLLAVLVGGSVVQSLGAAASSWGSTRRSERDAVASTLEWSRNGNVLILVLDSLQSDVFADVLEVEPRLRDALDGFRYYRLASSNGPTTYLSLPTIHGAGPYEDGQTMAQYYRTAVYEGSVLNRLAEAGYRTSYAVGVGGCPKAVATCVATPELARSRIEIATGEASQLLDIGLYRVVPDSLREAILRRGRGPLAAISEDGPVERAQRAAAALARLASASTVTESPPTAKMIHSMLSHPPAVLQPDCSAGQQKQDREGLRLQAQCALSQVVALLERLRSLGVYDASSLVVLADHGYRIESRFAAASGDPKFRRMVGSFNPLVLVKPAGSRGPLTTSDAPIELADVARALCDGSGCAPAEGLSRLDAVDPGRTRTAFWYTWNHRYWTLPQIPGLARYWIRGDLRRVESWSRQAAAYTPGTALEFQRGGNLGTYVGFGWGRRQEDHTWMADAEATLFLRGRFEPRRACELVLEARMSPPSTAGPQRVTIEVNGVPVGEVLSTDPDPRFERHRFTVPAAALSRSPETLIRFSAKADAPAGGDPPGARLALRSLALRPRP
jgi:hypothetical protein